MQAPIDAMGIALIDIPSSTSTLNNLEITPTKIGVNIIAPMKDGDMSVNPLCT